MTARKDCIKYQGACEGLQEKKYFEWLQEQINNCDDFKKRVQLKLYNNRGGCPQDIVLAAAYNIDYVDKKNRVAIFDCDFRYNEFKEAIKLCQENKIKPIYSIMNFNLFLILHKKYYAKNIDSNDNYEKDLKNTFNLNNSSDIKNEKSIDKILKQLTLNDVKDAIKRAHKLCLNTKENKQMIIIDDIYDQPYLNVHEFIENIFELIK